MASGHFEEMLSVGGKSNSLGRVNDVIQEVFSDKTLVEELYACMFSENAWVRMRAADAFEKVCREYPERIEPYIDRIQKELSGSRQPSIQWHIAQIYQEVSLTDEQKKGALKWLTDLLSTKEIDWIVAANAMTALVYFTKRGNFTKKKLIRLLEIQLSHKSNAVRKKANKFIDEISKATQ